MDVQHLFEYQAGDGDVHTVTCVLAGKTVSSDRPTTTDDQPTIAALDPTGPPRASLFGPAALNHMVQAESKVKCESGSGSKRWADVDGEHLRHPTDIERRLRSRDRRCV